MKKETKPTECYCDEKIVTKKCHCHSNGGGSNAIYGLSVIGALFYFLSQATSFGMVMIGIAKSIFWPAIFMFELLTYLKM